MNFKYDPLDLKMQAIKLKIEPKSSPLKLNVTKKDVTQFMSESDYQSFDDQKDHVYQIPDTYIGNSVQADREERVLDLETMLFKKSVIYIPEGVERLFIEILSNAGDNSARSLLKGIDPGEINISMTETTIKIRNGGIPIPVEMHKEKKVLVPELIFGRLMSSSSYDKTKKRQFSSRNGFGSKLTNIFSTNFKVTIGDPNHEVLYQKTWSKNMKSQTEHTLTPYPKDKLAFVEIEYTMDFKRFGYEKYPQEAFELYSRHAVDTAFTLKIPVVFNGNKFNIKNAKEYAKLYLGKDAVKNSILYYVWPEGTETFMKKNVEMAKEKGILPIMELCAVDSPDAAEKVSFVNNMLTRNGGVHYEAAFKAVASGVLDTVNGSSKKKKRGEKSEKAHKLTLGDVKKHVSLFVNCWIDDPIFDSQTKNELKAPQLKVNINENALKPITRWELLSRLYAELDAKHFRASAKSDGKKTRHLNMTKLEDANKAGTSESSNCTLYVTEGDSALTFSIKLCSHIPNGKGRDYIGMYPLKGKMLNVMNAPYVQIAENKEIIDLKKVLGLREGVNYMIEENYKTLRYGHLMVIADADVDGLHILGLLMNFFHCKFPSLIGRGFIKYLRTKILDVKKGNEVIKFYSHHEYEEWKKKTTDYSLWHHSYYKGLGTNVDSDILDESKDPKIVMTVYDEIAPYSFRLAFDQKLSNNRKDWISQWVPDYTVETMRVQPISSFINHQLIQYSISDIARSIPRFKDGLKISQRKIIWCAMKKWGKKSGTSAEKIKVAQFASSVADKMNYGHGEQSLSGAIVGMAQNFVGSNNMPYLMRDGEFGTRSKLGHDSAAPRYIFTRQEWWIPLVFKKEDNFILTMAVEEGEEVEPVSLLPILPMHLINGVLGIATGHSTFIPPHNPLDICYWLESKIKNIPSPQIIPWFRGFNGDVTIKQKKRTNDDSETDLEEDEEDKDEVEIDENTKFTLVTTGNFEIESKKIIVNELPIGRGIHKYKEYLDRLREEKIIKKYDNYSTTDKPIFEIYGMKNPSLRKLKLLKSYGMSNMVLIDDNDKPVKYNNAEEILETFYHIRLSYYQKRKEYIISNI